MNQSFFFTKIKLAEKRNVIIRGVFRMGLSPPPSPPGSVKSMVLGFFLAQTGADPLKRKKSRTHPLNKFLVKEDYFMKIG